MTDIRHETTAEVVETYYDLLKGDATAFDAERLGAILARDLVFEGPLAGRRVGAEGFVKGASAFAETARSLDLVHQLYAGDKAAALYDAEMPGGTVRFAEFFHVDGGRIRSLRLLYDPAEFRAKGGR